jgi:hypothetical protein
MLRSAAKTLLILALALPIIQAVLYWTRGLLTSMGDPAGAQILLHVGTACQVIWTVDLVGLVIVIAIIVVNESPTDQ